VSPLPLVVPLQEAGDVTLVGGKAINLYQLMRAGLPVPDGFVITTAAFRRARNTHPLSADLAEQILAAYRAMGQPCVAVRSSATAEDLAGASMAGQYDTFLNVTGPDAVLTAVKKCWQSLEGERVQTYLRGHAIDADQVAVAVVVQQLVPAEVSGVLFTANPRSGVETETVVEAIYGLGEGLVSGEVQPDVYRLHTQDGRLLDLQVADKSKALYPGHETYRPVPAERATRACLDHAQLQTLCDFGRQALRHFGRAQDLEWALAGNRIHILQARAITTLAETQTYHRVLQETRKSLQAEADAGRGPWVCHNLSETLPLPTPLTWHLIRHFMSGAGGFGRMHRQVGFTPAPEVEANGFLTLIAGRIYMDCARLPEMFCAGYPFRYDMERLRQDPDAAQQPPTVPRGSYRQLAAAARLGTQVTENLRALADHLDREFDRDFVPRVTAWCQAQAEPALATLSDAALRERWQGQQAQVLDDFGAAAFLPSMVEALAAADLRAFLAEHVWDHDPDILLQRLSVSPVMDTTLRSHGELQDVARGTRTLETWLAEHGYRGPGEFDLSQPRWFERPADVARLAEPLAHSPDLASRHEERCAEARQCLAEIKRHLSPEMARTLAHHVHLLQRYLRFREDGKAVLMRAFVPLRLTVLEFGRRLQLGDEVFFLTGDELIHALSTGYVPRDRIEQRQLEHRVAPRIALPPVIEQPDLTRLGVPALSTTEDSWPAHAVSHGISSGPARIVHDPTETHALGEHYILVCPSTDPAWTPLFVKAAGLILERGGSLSHGAIVARELGLPAVVLANATTLIAEGESVSIDAENGRVSRGQATEVIADGTADDPQIPYPLIPPPAGQKERRGNQRACLAALAWGVFLGLMVGLPAAWLKEPVFALVDILLWPLVPVIGRVWLVALVGAFFAVIPLLIQRIATDNPRLWEAKRRAAKLQKRCTQVPKGSARREAMLRHAAPVTLRTLKASMAGLAWILGPMMVVFLWMPERMDPAAWNADPGGLVTILAELDGEYRDTVVLDINEPLILEAAAAASQTLPPIRTTLEDLRREWQAGSDLRDFPWELQTAADQARETLLASLNAYLAHGIPPQKLTWRLRVPQEARGHYPVTVRLGDQEIHALTLAFGNTAPPVPATLTPAHSPLLALEAVYPRPLQQRRFWTPLAGLGSSRDFGWLGVYIVSYLGVMLVTKKLLGVP
jgi:pyruvate,water dikinase